MARKLYAICDKDLITVVVDLHPDAGPEAQIPDIEDWADFFPSCPVCGGSVGPPSEDSLNIYEDQDWHRKVATKSTVERLLVARAAGVLDDVLDKLAEHLELQDPRPSAPVIPLKPDE